MAHNAHEDLGRARPVRLSAGSDLRRSLESLCPGGFVLAGIGSLAGARVRYAGHGRETELAGDLEIICLQGSLSENGAHLHAVLSTANGQVVGGHVAYGNIVRTTAELLIVELPGWRMVRRLDPETGYPELYLPDA